MVVLFTRSLAALHYIQRVFHKEKLKGYEGFVKKYRKLNFSEIKA